MGGETKLSLTDQEMKGVGASKVVKPPSSFSSDDAEVKVPKRFYRRKACQICCATTTAVLVVVLITILVLSFTLFKAKDPVIKVEGMTLQSFSVNLDSSLTSLKLDVNLHLNVSVHNPNVASFKYGNSSTFLYYRGREVGRAAIPPGKVGAKKTENFETDLDIRSLQIVMDANLTSDLQYGVIPVNTYSSIRGTLNVINIWKHHAISTSDCFANILVTNTTLGDFKLKVPDMAPIFGHFETAKDLEEAEKNGCMVPHEGVNSSFDEADCAGKTSTQELDENLVKQRKKFGNSSEMDDVKEGEVSNRNSRAFAHEAIKEL